MSREVRRVPADWKHPTHGRYSDGLPRHVPMFDKPHAEALREHLDEDLPAWLEGERLWRVEGKVKRHDGNVQSVEEVIADTEPHRRPAGAPTYQWWAGEMPSPPNPKDYMPDWPADQRTHFMMYETCSEGTPISPAFEKAEDLARWLTDNGASAFGDQTATYDTWLAAIKGEPLVTRLPGLPNVLFL